ncbi:MAG: amidohydrolase family protein [Deltaproteobacteria bacterium]|nr:amidohydrolase family protein [Deltaproteobacteria bacterium]
MNQHRSGLVVMVPLFALAACNQRVDGDRGWTDSAAGDSDAHPVGDPRHGDGNGGDHRAGDSGGDVGPDQSCNRTWPVTAGGGCNLQAGNRAHVLLRADLLLPDQILAAAELLVTGGVIACAGCDCSASAGYADATVVTCGNALISPGLINAHDHIGFTQGPPVAHGTTRYEHRHEWRKGMNGKPKIPVPANSNAQGEAWGEMRQVMAGTTSLFGSGGAAGFLRNLDEGTHLEGLAHGLADYSTFPLGDSSGILAAAGCTTYPSIDDPASEQSFAAYVPHVGEGIGPEARNEFLCMSGTGSGAKDLLLPTAAFIHGIGLKSADIALMATDSAGLIWSPRSNTDLYGNTAEAPIYDRLGVRIALGTDWTATGSVTILRELACADSWNTTYWGGYFSDADLVSMVTTWAAELLGYDDVLGSLVPGKVADITIWNNALHPGRRAIIDARVADVLLVWRGDRALYGDQTIIEGLASASECELVDVCGRAKRLCATREIGATMASVKTTLGAAAYGLFFCDTPQNEPTCQPSRPGEYDGQPGAGDRDGDGVADVNDNCPEVFNPGIPVDLDLQSDSDSDGQGDLCDPCPLNPHATVCAAIDPNDRDGDRVPNAADNCPSDANPDQADGDHDGKGDACDSCPSDPNPADAPCPATIYAVKQRQIPVGRNVQIPDAIVTAVGSSDFFIQVDPALAGYPGVGHSGLYVFNNANAPLPAVGNRVSVTGTVRDFHGGIELDQPAIVVLDAGPVPLDPIVILPAAVIPGGADQDRLEGVLVRIEDLTVLDTTPTGAVGEVVSGEFTVTGGLSVDDGLYLVTPFVSEGETLAAVTGVLRYSWNRDKLWPRAAADIGRGPPALLSFGPAAVYVYDHQTGSSVPTLRVTLTTPGTSPVIVPITSADATTVAAVGDAVTVPAGQTSADVTLSSGNAGGPVQLTATLNGAPQSAAVTVLDGAAVALPAAIDPATVVVAPGQAVTLAVVLATPAPPAGQVLSLAATGVALSVPASVTVPFMQARQDFSLTAGTTAGTATLTATAGGASVTATVNVAAVVGPGLILVEVLYDPRSTDTNLEWVKLYNGGAETVDLAGYSLGWGGTSYTNGKLQLSGSVAAGACAVVGGPVSDAANADPVLGQAIDFNPDLQNGGNAADGIALFHLPAAQVLATSKPVDAVLYGGPTNSSRLIGPDGQPAPVNVPAAPSGDTLLRTGRGTWIDNPTPNSVLCVVIP